MRKKEKAGRSMVEIPIRRNEMKKQKSCKSSKPAKITFEALVELSTFRIHGALLEGGGNEMRSAVHLCLNQAIQWSKEK